MSKTKFYAAYSGNRLLDISEDKEELMKLYPNALILPFCKR